MYYQLSLSLSLYINILLRDRGRIVTGGWTAEKEGKRGRIFHMSYSCMYKAARAAGAWTPEHLCLVLFFFLSFFSCHCQQQAKVVTSKQDRSRQDDWFVEQSSAYIGCVTRYCPCCDGGLICCKWQRLNWRPEFLELRANKCCGRCMVHTEYVPLVLGWRRTFKGSATHESVFCFARARHRKEGPTRQKWQRDE